jgi:hypothetical protein
MPVYTPEAKATLGYGQSGEAPSVASDNSSVDEIGVLEEELIAVPRRQHPALDFIG